jgi:hypothetical protein
VNTPTQTYLDFLLEIEAANTTTLGAGSIGLVVAPFTPGPSVTLGGLTEASYNGYGRQALNASSIPFTGSDGLEYVELGSFRFQPTGSTSPNLCYGLFLTYGSSSIKLAYTDLLATPVALATPANQLTVTVRVGRSPAGNYGLNIVSA